MADTVAVVAVVLAVAVAGVAAAAPVASSAGLTAGTAAQATPVNDTDIAPGERMAGVVGAEQAAVESEVAVRAFERRVAVANSSTAKAGVVESEVENLQARLDELADREAELRRARENGTLSTGQYRARLAKLYAEQRALQRLANRTERVARDLPEQALREQGVNVTALRTLRSQARNLTGPGVAAVARDVAGESVSRPAGAGPPDFVENRTGGPPDSGNGPPGESERGPPANRSGGPASNGTGPPRNGTGAPGNGQGTNNGAGAPGNRTGPPGNETGPSEQSGGPNGNQTGGPNQGQGPAGNGTGGTDGGQGDRAGNSTGPGSGSGDSSGNDTGNGNDGEAGDGGGSGNNSDGASAETTLRVV
ncbi:MAG: hypothetical protein V5A44_04390 [Haloarculaceae archaeon]